jgi:hypothetical protein
MNRNPKRGRAAKNSVRVDFSFPNDDEKGSEVSAGGLCQGDIGVVRYTADRARSVEFANLRSCRIARPHGYHRLIRHRPEDFEALSAL